MCFIHCSSLLNIVQKELYKFDIALHYINDSQDAKMGNVVTKMVMFSNEQCLHMKHYM